MDHTRIALQIDTSWLQLFAICHLGAFLVCLAVVSLKKWRLLGEKSRLTAGSEGKVEQGLPVVAQGGLHDEIHVLCVRIRGQK